MDHTIRGLEFLSQVDCYLLCLHVQKDFTQHLLLKNQSFLCA